MNNPRQLNYTQQLEHRLEMALDDLTALVDYIDKNNMMSLLDKPTRYGDNAWTHIVNIEKACDLKDDESLSWRLYNTFRPIGQ